MREEIYILIDQYEAGELNAEEKLAFEKRLATDIDFAETVKLYRSLTEAFASKFHHEKEELLLRQNLSKIADDELGADKAPKVIKTNWYYWAAAASVVLLLGTFFYINFSSTPNYTDYAIHEPLALVERGDNDQVALQAEEAFNTKNYKLALLSLNKLLNDDEDNIELRLYKGISLLELNRYEEAETLLTSIQLSNSLYKNKAIWYLALCALKQKQYDRTRLLLLQIPHESEEYDQAEKLLNSL